MSDVTTEELFSRLDDADLVVLDVRTRAEYEGLVAAPCDPRAGRVPGAVHVDVQELALLDIDDVRRVVGAPPGADVIAYCHSGGRSAFAVEILRAAGYEARNYRGSWHAWSADSALPIETG